MLGARPPVPGLTGGAGLIPLSLFIASYRFEEPILQLYRATPPFFAILLLAVLVITYWPALSLTLGKQF